MRMDDMILVSVDDHVVEPPDLFDKHLPRDGELINAHDPDHFERILKTHIASTQAFWL